MAQATTVLGDVRKFYEWDWAGAEHAYRRAIEIDPHYALAHHWYAQLLAIQARHDEAFAEIEAARQCDPVSPVVNAFVSYISSRSASVRPCRRRRPEGGRTRVGRSAHIFFAGPRACKGRRLSIGDRRTRRSLRLAGPVPLFEANLGYAWARAGQRLKAEAILDGFNRGQFARVVSPVERALNLARAR